MSKRRPPQPRALPGMARFVAPIVKPHRPPDHRYEDALYAEIVKMVLPAPERQVQFDPTRRWRFDLAWPDRKLAVEVEGGLYVHGRHTRGAGAEEDCRKYNAATIAGWRVIRVSTGMVRSGEAIKTVWRALGGAAAYDHPR